MAVCVSLCACVNAVRARVGPVCFVCARTDNVRARVGSLQQEFVRKCGMLLQRPWTTGGGGPLYALPILSSNLERRSLTKYRKETGGGGSR